MKNKLFILLFIGIFVIAITGCGKKEKEIKKIEVKGPRVVCTYSEKDEYNRIRVFAEAGIGWCEE